MKNGEDQMKRKLKLPILLLAVVVMLSIFYIKEANDKDAPVGNNNDDNLLLSNLNPEFTEARLERMESLNSEILELEELIAGGTLTADKVLETTVMIDELKEIKSNETSLEVIIMEELEYDDVLVIFEDDWVSIDIYTELEASSLPKIQIIRMAMDSFGSECGVSIATSNIYE